MIALFPEKLNIFYYYYYLLLSSSNCPALSVFHDYSFKLTMAILLFFRSDNKKWKTSLARGQTIK